MFVSATSTFNSNNDDEDRTLTDICLCNISVRSKNVQIECKQKGIFLFNMGIQSFFVCVFFMFLGVKLPIRRRKSGLCLSTL